MNKITDYLKHSRNSLVREELFNHRLIYELKMAAIAREYHLKIFQATVDIEGYDLVIDDNDKIGRFQLKTRFESTTPSWKIHRSMLMPSQRNADRMNADYGLNSQNDNGVILLDIKSSNSKNEDFIIKYYYTDYYIIKLISANIIKKPQRIVDKANQTLKEIFISKGLKTRITVSKGLFVQVRNPSCLLGICGFESTNNNHFNALTMKLLERNKMRIANIDSNTNYALDKKIFLNALDSLIIK